MVKVKSTNHGAVKMGLGVAKLGATGPGKANAGTVNPIDTMGTGRVVSMGSTAAVSNNKMPASRASIGKTGYTGGMNAGKKKC